MKNLLYFSAIACGALSGFILLVSKSAVHEILAAVVGLGAGMFLCAGALVGTIEHLGNWLAKQTPEEKARPTLAKYPL